LEVEFSDEGEGMKWPGPCWYHYFYVRRPIEAEACIFVVNTLGVAY
jgi:hypothetical protein